MYTVPYYTIAWCVFVLTNFDFEFCTVSSIRLVAEKDCKKSKISHLCAYYFFVKLSGDFSETSQMRS